MEHMTRPTSSNMKPFRGHMSSSIYGLYTTRLSILLIRVTVVLIHWYKETNDWMGRVYLVADIV